MSRTASAKCKRCGEAFTPIKAYGRMTARCEACRKRSRDYMKTYQSASRNGRNTKVDADDEFAIAAAIWLIVDGVSPDVVGRALEYIRHRVERTALPDRTEH